MQLLLLKPNSFPLKILLLANYGTVDNPVSSTVNFPCDPIPFLSNHYTKALENFLRRIILNRIISARETHCTGYRTPIPCLLQQSPIPFSPVCFFSLLNQRLPNSIKKLHKLFPCQFVSWRHCFRDDIETFWVTWESYPERRRSLEGN
jgi:hypothetical protein